MDAADGVLSAIQKLRKIVKAVRSSPQRCQTWAREIQVVQGSGRALDYRNMIDSFVLRNKDLRDFELSAAEWDSIKLVTSWLKSFRSATTEMSTTKVPMLSMVHAVFRGLQDDLKEILCNLPNSVSPNVKWGLTDAHWKLSDYYYKYDESPFYTWAARM
ncbi:hypothetical protein K443DRAFT_124286 [Laccaria amethystina LaAM-08-1]|uniref:Uncharacterized protein n=1 Tax=Laccaria amethystina LaAM-08-1 TaxID=1095629 RepID=A0A0C9WL04_9AGAR|nr:hypothetical protein K443DRAFT_124286 [Laccaria amethystina LaAM-08-1]